MKHVQKKYNTDNISIGRNNQIPAHSQLQENEATQIHVAIESYKVWAAPVHHSNRKTKQKQATLSKLIWKRYPSKFFFGVGGSFDYYNILAQEE